MLSGFLDNSNELQAPNNSWFQKGRRMEERKHTRRDMKELTPEQWLTKLLTHWHRLENGASLEWRMGELGMDKRRNHRVPVAGAIASILSISDK